MPLISAFSCSIERFKSLFKDVVSVLQPLIRKFVLLHEKSSFNARSRWILPYESAYRASGKNTFLSKYVETSSAEHFLDDQDVRYG